MKFVAAIHGILTRQTDPAWPWALQGHAIEKSLQMVVQAEHYWAGPFPIWNTFFKNPRLAKAFAKRLQMLGNDGSEGDIPISIVAHSNGTNIAVDLAWELRDRGQYVAELILIGSALSTDVEESGLLDLVECGAVGKVVAYCSREDEVIRPQLEIFSWGYGALGSKGLTREGRLYGITLSGGQRYDGECSFITRWFDDYSHSDYFDDENRDQTFELIARDLGIKSSKPPTAPDMVSWEGADDGFGMGR